MKRLSERPLVVLLGVWNFGILMRPDWLKRYLFPAEEKLTIDLVFSPNGLPSGTVHTSFMKMDVSPARVAFAPLVDSVDSDQVGVDLAAKLVETLSHTPLSACGVNYVYQVPVTSGLSLACEGMLSAVGLDDSSWLAQKFQFASMLPGTGGAGMKPVRLTVDTKVSSGEGGQKTLEFAVNFHRDVQALADLKAAFDSLPISECRKRSEAMAKAMATLAGELQ